MGFLCLLFLMLLWINGTKIITRTIEKKDTDKLKINIPIAVISFIGLSSCFVN